MSTSCLLKRYLLLACLSIVVLPAYALTTISGGDKNLQYTGRIDRGNPKTPQISWPGTTIAGNFTGHYLAFTLDDQFGKNFFNIFIDGDLQKPIIIQAEKGEKTYLVADKLAAGKHSFLLTKRTEGEEGATTINNILLADEGKLLAPPERLKRKIEFFGDSVTSGAGNEAADGASDGMLKEKNNFMTYATIAARNLNAEAHITSQSGIGIMISWFPFIMPQFYDQLNAVGNNDTQWNFASWTPDVVVINLFQNDSWLTDREHRMNPNPTDEQRIQAYIDFVKTIRGKYPNAYIICALGSMDATKEGSKWPGYITTAVARIQKDNPKETTKMDSLFFEFTGYEAHPRVKQHQANAATLTAFIKQKMNW